MTVLSTNVPTAKWANKRNDADKASSVHKTQGAAAATAKTMLGNQGGGELTELLSWHGSGAA